MVCEQNKMSSKVVIDLTNDTEDDADDTVMVDDSGSEDVVMIDEPDNQEMESAESEIIPKDNQT